MKPLPPLKATAIALSLVGTGSMSFADIGEAFVDDTNPGLLKVKSNGQDYTQLDLLGNFTIVGKLTFDTGVVGRIKSWQAYPQINNGYGIATPVAGLSAYKQSKSYPVFQRPRSINKTLAFSIPGAKVKNAAVAMCNWKANNLRDQGKSNLWIFNRNHDVHFTLRLNASVDSNGAGSNEQLWQADLSPHEFMVRCMKWSGVQIPTYDGPGLASKPSRTHGNGSIKKPKFGTLARQPRQVRPSATFKHRQLQRARRHQGQ